MTYEEYQQSIIVSIEAMRETRRRQNDEQQQLQLEINEKCADAKRRYLEELAALRAIQRDKAKAIGDKWKAERMRLHLEQAKIVDQWHREHGISLGGRDVFITPPLRGSRLAA